MCGGAKLFLWVLELIFSKFIVILETIFSKKLAHWIYIVTRLDCLKSAVWYPFELYAGEHVIKNCKNTSKFVFFTIIVRL